MTAARRLRLRPRRGLRAGPPVDAAAERRAAANTAVRVALAEAGLDVRVVRDGGDVAERLGVRVAPTALVFDTERVLRYRGPIDDDRRARGKDARAYLVPAVRAVGEGRAIEAAEVRAFGSAVR